MVRGRLWKISLDSYLQQEVSKESHFALVNLLNIEVKQICYLACLQTSANEQSSFPFDAGSLLEGHNFGAFQPKYTNIPAIDDQNYVVISTNSNQTTKLLALNFLRHHVCGVALRGFVISTIEGLGFYASKPMRQHNFCWRRLTIFAFDTRVFPTWKSFACQFTLQKS